MNANTMVRFNGSEVSQRMQNILNPYAKGPMPQDNDGDNLT